MYQNTTFRLIPLIPHSKKPLEQGYNKPEYQPTINTNQVALAHLPSGTCSLDIDDYNASSLYFKEHFNIDLKTLIESYPYIYNGNPNKFKIIFKLSAPLRTKQVSQGRKVIFELTCIDSKGLTAIDTIPPSVHPDTKLEYQWIGDFQQIQELPTWLNEHWQSLLVVNKPTMEREFNTNYDEIWEALSFIDSDCPRLDWLNVAMAIHHADAILGENRGFTFFDTWSQGSVEKYNRIDTKKTYDSIELDDKGIGIGTLLKMAADNGWRKKTDISGIFQSIAPTTKLIDPERVMEGLRPPAPNLDLKLMSPMVQAVANELSLSIGCDPLTTILSCLAVASGSIDSRIKLKLDEGFYVKPILWLMTVGDPANKKTPASSPIFKILEKIEMEDHQQFAAKKIMWEGDEAKYNRQKADFLKYGADPLNSSMLVNDNSSPPPTELRPEPTPLRVIVQDVLSQKLVEICASNPKGVLCYMDEMSGWVKRMVTTNSVDDRSTWTRSIEGKNYQRDRMGTGDTLAVGFAVSIYGNIQPHILERYIDDLSDDGLLQRFIPAVLRPSYDELGHPVSESISVIPQWETTVRKLFTLTKHTYTLTPEAHTEFRNFQKWYIKFKKNTRRYNQDGRIFMGAIGKLEGVVGRLALVFHLIETTGVQSISLDTMQRVINFVKSYIIPSYKYTYSEIGGAKEYAFSIWITNYIVRRSVEPITLTLSELKRAGRRYFGPTVSTDNFKKDAVVRDEMTILESYGWVVSVGDKNKKWMITDELVKNFKSYRKQLIDNREKLQRTFKEYT